MISIFKNLDQVITETVESLEQENSNNCFMVNELYRIQYDFGRCQMLEKLDKIIKKKMVVVLKMR